MAMIERSAALRERLEAAGVDWDLLLHLVASHHGWCRALGPVLESVDGGDPVAWMVEDQIELNASSAHGLDRLDSGVTERFWSLNRKYGRHELAWFEALLRLADHRQSAREEAGNA
jgi:CRISPR-associated endonuclease/helicase Cas3